MKEEYQTWGDVYSVEFDIVVNQLPNTGVLNVFVFILTTGLGRIPSFNVRHDGQFVIKNTALSGYSGKSIKFKIGKTYHVAIEQLKIESKYWFKIIIDDEVKEKIENTDPQSFSDVQFYTSGLFENSVESFTNQFGTVCNLKICHGISSSTPTTSGSSTSSTSSTTTPWSWSSSTTTGSSTTTILGSTSSSNVFRSLSYALQVVP